MKCEYCGEYDKHDSNCKIEYYINNNTTTTNNFTIKGNDNMSEEIGNYITPFNSQFIVASSREFRNMASMKIKKLHPNAIIPKHQTKDSAGVDLHACIDEDILIAPQSWKLIPTGLSVKIPTNLFGGIYPRSGNALKYGINCKNCTGVIDSDYTGAVGVILANEGDEPFLVRHGDRIAQLIIQPYFSCTFIEVDDLDSTVRGNGGFGSTGA